MSGYDLFNTLINSTGVETPKLRNEMLELLKKNNIRIEDLNINILRGLMANYLLDSLPIQNES